MLKNLASSFKNAAVSTLPISIVVIIISLFFPKTILGTHYGLFTIGSVLLIVGLAIFSMGIDIALTPIGREVGSYVSKSKKIWLVFLVPLTLGFIITLAEPGVQVLTSFMTDTKSTQFIITVFVSLGFGLFLMISILRIFFKWQLRYVFLAIYGIIFIMAGVMEFITPEFVTVALDSGGVSTGAVTVPFLMAFTVGIATVAHGRKDSEGDENFGSVALCTVGPFFAMLIFGFTGKLGLVSPSAPLDAIQTFADIMKAFGLGFLTNLRDVALSIAPVAAIFVIFQVFAIKLKKTQVIRIVVGLIYSYVGLTLFLTGVNVGFAPVGSLLGYALASSSIKWILVPVGGLVGALIVLAEPSVHALTKQVNEMTSGALSRKSMLILLCIGVGFAIAVSFLRVLTGIRIWWVLLPIYGICFILMFFAPKIFTGIAFDSGGVASGPMTVTFALPFVIGACTATGGNVFTDAFGVVGSVAMMPIIVIMISGVIFKVKLRKAKETSKLEQVLAETQADVIVDFDDTEVTRIKDAEVLELESQTEDNMIIDFFDDEEEDTEHKSKFDHPVDFIFDDEDSEINDGDKKE